MEVAVEGGGGCDVVTLSPVLEAGGVSLAPIGLVDMLNAGGAVLSCTLSGGFRVVRQAEPFPKTSSLSTRTAMRLRLSQLHLFIFSNLLHASAFYTIPHTPVEE